MYSKKIIVLLSGEIASGKSTVCEGLVKQYDFHVVSTKEVLKNVASRKLKGAVPEDREFFMKFGRELDEKTKGKWVLDEIQHVILQYDRVLIDAARISEQIDEFRERYGIAVVHIHIDARPEWRREHFITRGKQMDKFKTDAEGDKMFKEYSEDPTEAQVHSLKDKADLVIYAEDSSGARDQVVRAASFLRLLPPIDRRNVDVVIGGQFGSEGKGQVAAYLSPEYDCLVRVGGPNAGHKVFASPNPHVFHILPSGSVNAPGSFLVIGAGAVFSEEIILKEINEFQIDPLRLFIDENATLITQADKDLEAKIDKIGSTKQGVGAATANNIMARLLSDDKHKAKHSKKLKPYITQTHNIFANLHAQNKKILLEGTQGTLLSLHHGEYPYVTSRDTTVGGCLAECGFGPLKVRKIVMVTRRYPIRVQSPDGGTSGFFHSTELKMEEIARRAEYDIELLKKTEITSTTKKPRRIAEFSWDLFRRACETNTPTDIALTFADYISFKNQKARRYDQLTPDATKFIDELERCSGVPVSLISTRFAHRAIIDRRNWI